MNPINIILGLNLIITFGANASGAKKDLHEFLQMLRNALKIYLQTLPPNLAVFILVLIILSVFEIGTLDYNKYAELSYLRYAGLVMYLIFSWIQIWSFKKMGEYYSNEIVLLKNHELITSGPFRFVRHPLYLSQMLSDLGASLALLSYIALPFVILEIPILIIRAKYEDGMLLKHFGEKFLSYKKKSGLFIPFLG